MARNGSGHLLRAIAGMIWAIFLFKRDIYSSENKVLSGAYERETKWLSL